MNEHTQKLPDKSLDVLDAFDQRIVGDDDVSSGLDREMVSEMIDQAREFLQAVRMYLGK